MKTHNLTQGTKEWHEFRLAHFTASDAPAMLGISKYKTRESLLKEKALGIFKEYDAATLKRFERGHRFENLARPLAEKEVGAELYPVTGSRGKLSASFDGLTLLGCTCFEHKTLNDEIRKCKFATDLHEQYRAQMEQQLFVSGAETCLFIASSWDDNGNLICDPVILWYESDAEMRARILAGWDQFEKDLQEYAPNENIENVLAIKVFDQLPALHIEVSGLVKTSNLDIFKERALEIFDGINIFLKDDQDFFDAENTIKWCKDVESKLDAAKENALGQTASIDDLFKTIDAIKESARSKRLLLDKLVKKRKDEIKDTLIFDAFKALEDYHKKLSEDIKECKLPQTHVNFAEAVKGLKTVDSMKNALDALLLKSKCECDVVAKSTKEKINFIKSKGEKYSFLFEDIDALICESIEGLAAIAYSRIAKFRDAQQVIANTSAAVTAAADAITPAPAEQTQSTPPNSLMGKVNDFIATKNYGRGEKKIREALFDFVDFCEH